MVNEYQLKQDRLITPSQCIDLGKILNQSIKTKNEIILLDIIESLAKKRSDGYTDLIFEIDHLREALNSVQHYLSREYSA
jgi:hypothetical protein